MNSILKVKDKDGNWTGITAIRGDDGKSAYAQAKDGGYTGTEEEFITVLNGLAGTLDESHVSDLENPHKVTAKQVEALPIIGGELAGNLKIHKEEYATLLLENNAENRGEITYDNGILHIGSSVNGVKATLAISSDGALRLWKTGDSKGYRLYSEHNKPMASDVGAISKTGDTMTGHLVFENFDDFYALRKGRTIDEVNHYVTVGVGAGGAAAIEHYTDELLDGRVELSGDGLKFKPSVSEAGKCFFGEHNKPTGTYQGDGQTTTRAINVNGIGNMLLVVSAGGMALVTSAGAIWKPSNNTNINGVVTGECNYSGGVLTLKTAAAALNMSGVTYTYQIL